MKRTLCLAALLALAAATGLAEWTAGRGALQLEAGATGVYDSNLSASADGFSDYYLSLEPVLRYRDNDARFKTDASFGARFKRYLDHPSSDSDDADLHFNWSMARDDGHTTGATLAAGYVENTEPVLDVNSLVRSRTFFANTSGEVLLGGRNLLSAGYSYRDSNRNIGSDQTFYQGRVGYNFVGFTDGTVLGLAYVHQRYKTGDSSFGLAALDQEADSVAASVAHPIYTGFTGTLTAGYRWLDRGAQEAALGLFDRSGAFYSVGFEGSFLPRQNFPKTTGTFRVAYEQAETPGLNERSNERLVGRVNVTWAARERTLLTFFATRAQDLTIADATVVTQGGGLEVAQRIGEFIHTGLILRYTDADFVNLGRTDQRYEAEANGAYQINRAWSSRLGYRFLHSVSDATIANFDRHIVSLSLAYVF